MFVLAEITSEIARLTMPLPVRPKHVHCYLLRAEHGWILVDTGLGIPDYEDLFAAALSGLDAPVVRIVVTHFHPDHVGGAEPAAAVTGAPVHQGELDYALCEAVWGSRDWPRRIAGWFVRNGLTEEAARELQEADEAVRPVIRFAREPRVLRAGDRLDGWEIVDVPGHADGHLALLRHGILVAGDHLLPDVTPAIGLYPDQRPDPLGDYVDSLGRTIDLAPTLALPGHGEPIRDPPARAREILEHHRERLDEAAAALSEWPRSGYEISLDLFGGDLPLAQRRFAVAETLSHLERLVATGRARRTGDNRAIAYTGRERVGRRPDS